MKTTTQHFDLTIDELLASNGSGYTKEENLLFDSGLEIIFLDNDNEFSMELEGIKEHMGLRGYGTMDTLKTINERIAVILK